MKRCTKCGQEKPETEFYLSLHRGRRRLDAWCKECEREDRRQRSRANPKVEREATLRKKGISGEKYDSLLLAQNGRCAICGTDKPGNRISNFVVDHDHACCPGNKSCGKCVRALLCTNCNQGLGKFNDDRDLLNKASRYLERY